MKVQELFNRVAFCDFFRAFCEHENVVSIVLADETRKPDEKIAAIDRLRNKLQQAYNYFLTAPTVESENIVFVTPSITSSEQCYSFLVKYDEFEKSKYGKAVERYAYDFDDPETILGCNISDASLQDLGEAFVLYGVFSELTFFGLMPDERSKRKDEVEAELIESQSQITNALPTYHTVEEAFRNMGYVDMRLDFEKDFDKKMMMNRMAFSDLCFIAQLDLERHYRGISKE